MKEPRPGHIERPIDAEVWRKAKDLFTRLSEATPQERSGVLGGFDRVDPVRVAAERLLRSLDNATGFLGEPPARLAEQDDAADGAPLPASIGPYTPLERLGEGGFGIVYRARQHHPVERDVAIKVLRSGLESPQVLARFGDERRYLAKLDHPDVVRVLDAGATDDGRLFVVMDLVVGLPITAFVLDAGLGIEDRLRLFVRVCRAVHAVHQRGVIHRDLKPSNIVVADSDDGPRPRIIDFGIAAALDASDRVGWTQVGTPIGTPRYASPEQASASQTIDTRTDVYSLGMILGEMLCGSTPRANAWGLEIAAMPPSQEAKRTGNAPLARQLRGDLDRIVLKATAWDPTHRYDGASGLADDVERHLAGLPVLAAGPGRLYTAGKLIRRHQFATAATTLAALSLVLGLILSMHATREANRQRQIAESNARRAAFIGSFLLNTIERNADPDARGREVVLDEVALEALAREAVAGLEEDPATMLDLLETIGVIQHKIGLYDDAAESFMQAFEHDRSIVGGPSERGVRLQMLLADTLGVEHAKGDLPDAFLRSALADAEQLFAENDPRLLSVRIRTPLPLEELERLVALLEADPSARAADVIAGLIEIHFRLAFGPDPARSVPYTRRWYERSLEHHGASHSMTVNAMTTYASVESIHGSPHVALPLLVEALDRTIETFGPDHHHAVTVRRVLARVYGETGQPHLGIPHAIEHERQTRTIEGEHSPQHAGALRILGTLYAQAGDPVVARETLSTSLSAMRQHWPPAHNMVTAIEARLADVHLQLGDLDEADTMATRALASMQVSSMAYPIALATSVRARVLQARGDLDQAAALIDATLAQFQAAGVGGRSIDTLMEALDP